MIVAGQGISSPRQATAPNPEALRSAAEERIKNGSDWIKVYGVTWQLRQRRHDTNADLRRDEGHRRDITRRWAQGRDSFVRTLGCERCRYEPAPIPSSTESIWTMRPSGRWCSAEPCGFRQSITIGTMSMRRTNTVSNPKPSSRCRTTFRRTSMSTRRAVKAGVRIGMGSDAVYLDVRT